MSTPAHTLIKQIGELHRRVVASTVKTIQDAAACGALLLELKRRTPEGDWELTLEGIGMVKSTAWKYMRVAERWDAKTHKLENGITLCDLYREFGILPPLEGGGRRLGRAELERRKAVEQMTFRFEAFETGVLEVARFTETNQVNPFQTVEKPKLETLREQVETTLRLIDEALKAEVDV